MTPRPQGHPWIREFSFNVNPELIWDTNNVALSRSLSFQAFRMQLHSGDTVQFQVTPTYELLDDNFRISRGVVLPAWNEYWFTRYQLTALTAARRVLSAGVQVALGDFYSGTRRDYLARLTLRPAAGMSYGVQGSWNVVDLPEGDFTTTVYSAEANNQFGPWVSLANTLQYDNVTEALGWQLRFRWVQRPGNDLYLVYTHNWQRVLDGLERRFETLDHRAATKLLYTLRF